VISAREVGTPVTFKIYANAGPLRHRPPSTLGTSSAGDRVVSFVVSLVQHSTHGTAPRYDTDAQNTALMLHFVVSDRVPVLHGVQGVVRSNPTNDGLANSPIPPMMVWPIAPLPPKRVECSE
jgi:hypothetical protein